MGISQQLRERTATTWDAAVGHRFVEELWSGGVDPRVLAHYLVQDFQFCDAFLALMGAAVATCDDPGARIVHARQLGLVAGDENAFFHRSFDALAVPPSDRVSPRRTGATEAFVALMDEAGASADHASVLAVLLVAEWLYLDWATRPGAPLPDDPVAAGWIELHRGPAFEAWVTFLRAEFDRAAPAPHGAAATLFARAVDCELAFFDSAYTA